MTTFPKKMDRRGFLLSQAALVAVTGLPALAAASSSSTVGAGERRAKMRWETITATELSQFVGQRFSARTEHCGDFVMRLSSVDEVVSGPHRPRWLARREGLIATFESPDMEPLVRAGHQTCHVRNFWLGDADLFLGPVPTRSGGHVIELVLN